jgi:hypothetical protein
MRVHTVITKNRTGGRVNTEAMLRNSVNDALETAARLIEERYKDKVMMGYASKTHQLLVKQHTNIIRKLKIKEPENG